MRKTILLFSMLLLANSCKKEGITVSENANDLFYLERDGSQMPVKVQGNTASKVFVVIIHGGPGGEAIQTYNGDISAELKKNYAVAFWDQRNGGSTQGQKGGKLSVDVFVQDLEHLILLIKQLYGKDSKLFLYAHSWGGLLSSAYLVKGQNQQEISGWIDIDGVHNMPLNDIATRNMLDSIGKLEYAAGRNQNEWKKIMDYINEMGTNIEKYDSYKLNRFAFEAEGLMKDSIKSESGRLVVLSSSSSLMSTMENSAFIGVNYNFFDAFLKTNLADKMHLITIPSLFCWGRYDFVVPSAVGYEAFERIGTDRKKKAMYIFNYSGHSPMFNQTKVFNEKVIEFVEANK